MNGSETHSNTITNEVKKENKPENDSTIPTKHGSASCPLCSKTESLFVYALGQVSVVYPSKGIEREFLHASKKDGIKLIDNNLIHDIIKKNSYLANEVCWVLRINDIESYVLSLTNPAELPTLIESLTHPNVAIIGRKNIGTNPTSCGGLLLPLVMIDKIYVFKVDEFIKQIPIPENYDANDFTKNSKELYEKLTDNLGASDEERATNFLAIRSSSIYSNHADMLKKGYFCDNIRVLPSSFFGARKIYDVVFSYTNTNNATRKSFVRLDMTEKWPFLVSSLKSL